MNEVDTKDLQVATLKRTVVQLLGIIDGVIEMCDERAERGTMISARLLRDRLLEKKFEIDNVLNNALADMPDPQRDLIISKYRAWVQEIIDGKGVFADRSKEANWSGTHKLKWIASNAKKLLAEIDTIAATEELVPRKQYEAACLRLSDLRNELARARWSQRLLEKAHRENAYPSGTAARSIEAQRSFDVLVENKRWEASQ